MRKIFIILFILWINNIFAAIVVMPFEDLSKDLNGLDLQISTTFANKLVDRGFEVVYPVEIMNYLEKRKNPVTGWIDRISAQEISKVFNAKLILLGTIIEKSRENLEFCLAVRMLILPDYRLVWGKVATISKSEQISILDLKRKKWNQLVSETIDKILFKIPETVLTKSFSRPDMDIESVTIEPKFLKKNHYLNCRAVLRFSGRIPDKMFLTVNNRKLPVTLFKNSFNIKIKAPEKDNRYPVVLTCKWGKPFYFSKKFFLGSFTVDNKRPRFFLNYKFGTVLNKKIFFSKFIKIIPVIKGDKNISKWLFEVFSVEDNQTLTKIENYGNIPNYFIWKGLNSRGAMLPNGKYKLSVTIWDKAKNVAQDSLDIYLIKMINPPEVTGVVEKEKIYIKFNFKPHPVPISFCRIEIFDENGSLIASKISENGFINEIELPNHFNIKKVYYNLIVRDILGNKLSIKKRRIEFRKIEKEKKIEKKWINEF